MTEEASALDARSEDGVQPADGQLGTILPDRPRRKDCFNCNYPFDKANLIFQ